MLLSVINPFLLRNSRDNFVFAFVKQLESLPNKDVIYVITKHYINPDLWEKYRERIEFGKVTKIDDMNIIFLDDNVIDEIQGNCDQNIFYVRYLTEKMPSLQVFFRDILSQVKKGGYQIEAVLSWGNCPSLESVAREHGIPIIYNERAPLRSPLFVETSYFDFSGVNGNTESSVRFERFVDEFMQTPRKLLSEFELQGLVLKGAYRYYRDIFKYKYPIDAKVGLPLQVENDSNVLAFSNGYDNYKLIEYAANRISDKELLIRKHPFGKDDYTIYGENDNSKNSLDFLLKCERIITINSGIALEALLFGIDIDILGDSPFSISNMSGNALSEDKYRACLSNFLILGYIVPSELAYTIDYIRFRLNKPSELDIFSHHLNWWRAEFQTMYTGDALKLSSNFYFARRYKDVSTTCELRCMTYELLFLRRGEENEPYSGILYPFKSGESIEINIKKEQILDSNKMKIRFHAYSGIMLHIDGFFSQQDNSKYKLNHNGTKIGDIIIFQHKIPEIEIDFCSKVNDDLCFCVYIQLSSEIDNDWKFHIKQLETLTQEKDNQNRQLQLSVQSLENELTAARVKVEQAEAMVQFQGVYSNAVLFISRTTWFLRKNLEPKLVDVVTAYRYFLGRKPENVSVVIGHMQSKTINDLINSFKGSREFRERLSSSASFGSQFACIVPSSIRMRGRSLVVKFARGILTVSLQGIRSMPPLKRILLSVVRRFPSVGTRFLSFAASHPPRQHKRAFVIKRCHKPDAIQSYHIPSLLKCRDSVLTTKTKRVLYYYVDHTVGCCVNTGMQRVARSLARGLIEAGENVIFVRWCPELKALVKINHNELKHFCKWQGPIISQQMMATYPIPNAPAEPISNRDHNGDSWLVVPEVTYINFHGYAPTLDVVMKAKEARLKTAFIFYDAIPLRCEEFKNIAPMHTEYMQHLLVADLVVPISSWSARDLISFFIRYEKSALTTIPFVEPLLLPGETRLTESLVESSVATQKIILSVGTIEKHKNQGILLEAFGAFCKRHPHIDWELVLVGNLHENMAAEINTAISRNKNIIYRGNISDEDLDGLYRICTFTVFPSYEEGFGLPIVESLNYGKPCICADFGAMAEAAEGGGCLRIDVRDAGRVEQAISTLINDPDKLCKLEQEAKNRKKVTWSDYTNDFRSLFDSVTMSGNKIGKVFYLVHHTCVFPYNTGIQRVVRNLARALIEIGLDLVPLKWDINTGFFVSPTNTELLHLAQWNGPKVDDWTSCDLKTFKPTDWLFIPEIISASSAPSIATIIEAAHARGLRVASIFFDAIPYKMQDIYPLQATKAHYDYMCALNDSDLVFSISEHSNADLLKFLQSQTYLHTPNLFERLRVALLPGEFTESPRNIDVKPAGETVRILCVGTVEPRKNHLKLLKAFAMVQRRLPADKRVQLIIVGSAPFSGLEKEIQNFIQMIPAVQWEREIADSRLHELYRSSDFTIYPSLEEGFGLPILESLWNARPCICRNASSMIEIGADGGGCLMVDTADIDELALGIERLIVDEEFRLKLAQEAVSRPFKKWRDYAGEISESLAQERVVLTRKSSVVSKSESWFRTNMINLEKRPLLSICITTYNRAEWLSLNLKNLTRLIPTPLADVEIVVCDNASTDYTNEVVKSYEFRPDLRFYRNLSNVGMLGNLRVTAHHARGQYIWIIGDDDLLVAGAIEKVLMAIRNNPDTALLYLNYAYTREENAKRVTDLSVFFKHAIPITKPTIDTIAPISQLSMLSENLFTAIYCLVFRRDHALRAYTQDTSGRPFSTMLTCMPTTYYVLHNMMDEKGVWLGTPQIVVNMNVSWLKYASLWILERIPEALDLAEKMGALHKEVDKRRIAHLPQIWYWLDEIIKNDSEKNAIYFNPARLFSRFKHLSEFQSHIPEFIEASRKIGSVYPTCFTKPSEDSFSVSSAK